MLLPWRGTQRTRRQAARENDEPERPLPKGSDEAKPSNGDESTVYGNEEHETHLTAETKGLNRNQSEPKRHDANELNISSLVSVEPEILNSTEEITTKLTLLPTGSGKGSQPPIRTMHLILSRYIHSCGDIA